MQLVFAACAAVWLAVQAESRAPAFALVGVHVVPLDQEAVLHDRTVLVRGATIEAILPEDAALAPDVLRIDARDRYLMPGLVDCYSHVDGETHLLAYVASGITTVKDSPAPIEHLGLRDRVARGELLGPTLLCYSTDLDGEPEYPAVEAVTSPEQAASVVAEMARLGYDGIMVYSMLSRDTYLAVLEAAREHALPVTGHLSPRGDLTTLANGSQRSVENLVGFVDFATGAMAMDEATARYCARLLRQGEVYCVPTLTVHKVRGALDEALLAAEPAFALFPESMRGGLEGSGLTSAAEYHYGGARRVVELFREEGVRILFGTDAGYPLVLPGFSAHGPRGELRNLVEAGLSPYEALRAATSAAAEFLGLADELGTVTAGKRADLVLLEADPLADVANVERIAGVVLRGRWLPRDELDRLLREQAALHSERRERFAGMPPLPTEGIEELAAEFVILVNGGAVGRERMTRRRAADGTRRLFSQASIDPWYSTRTTLCVETDPSGRDRAVSVERESIDGRYRLELRREGASVRVTGHRPAYGAIDLEEPCSPEAELGGPILSNGLVSDLAANFVGAAERLSGLEVGSSSELVLKSIELNSAEFFRNATVGELRWSVRRAPDEPASGDARGAIRVYEVTTDGRAGRGGYDLTLRVDASGLPLEVRAGEGDDRRWTYRRITP